MQLSPTPANGVAPTSDPDVVATEIPPAARAVPLLVEGSNAAPNPTTPAMNGDSPPGQQDCVTHPCGLPVFGLVAFSTLSAALEEMGNDTDRASSMELLAGQEGGAAADFAVLGEDFRAYFVLKGGVRVLGYPVSRSFVMLGYEVQLFQKRMLVRVPNQGVAQINLAAGSLFPYGSVNFSVLPHVDDALLAAAPKTTDPDYSARVPLFVQSHVPDKAFGMPVGFLGEYRRAEPVSARDDDLVAGLETWGLPTSEPTLDPNNAGFVYQRFQHGVMMYDETTGLVGGMPLGDYIKAIITARNLPDDLAQSAAESPLYAQYSPSSPGGLARPWELPGTDLSLAFER